jgi:transcriptional regulator with XRE-family HTH domain
MNAEAVSWHRCRFCNIDCKTASSPPWTGGHFAPKTKEPRRARLLLQGCVLIMSDRETFGPRLRSERERRGISLDTIASVTKVGAELWDGLERNDFSRWPTGIFARAFVRDYATAVGLDADEVVDEFCRLFAIGDRRAERLIKAQGALIGHQVSIDGSMVPPTGERRAGARAQLEQARARRIRLAPRAVAAGVDTTVAVIVATGVSAILATGFWTTAAAVGLAYYGASTIALGTTPGTKAVDALRQRLPALFAVQDRAHA